MTRRPTLLAAGALLVGAAVVAAEPDPRAPLDRAERELPEGWYARVDTTQGRIVFRLHPEQAPQSVAHFAALADARLPWSDVVTGETKKSHYYDGLTVHRAVAGQRFEAGDPYGTGAGSPKIFVPPELDRPVNFSRAWKVGLTRAPLGRISGAQFFMTAASQPIFTPRHPCIGTVVLGQDVVFSITSVKTYGNGRPIEPVIIERLRIFSVGDPDPLPEPVPYTPKTETFQVKEEFRRK